MEGFAEGHGRADLDVRGHRVVTDELDHAGFDLVHARAVLEHLPARDDVLARLVAALRPGGWLLVEDVDLADSPVGTGPADRAAGRSDGSDGGA